jgi:hypothetical protein
MTALTPSSPEYRLQQNDAAQYPPTVRAVRHIIGFLQWRFSLLPAGAYHWAPEDLETPEAIGSEIYISGDTPLPMRAVGDRPAITVLRSQLAFQGVGTGDVASHNWQTGGKTYMDLLPTTICINVLARLPFVAERLAWFVHEQIFTLREEIVRTEKCILSIGARATLTPPSPAGPMTDSPDSDWIVVSLFLPTYLQHRTAFVPINVPVLKKLDVQIEVSSKDTGAGGEKR